MDVATSVPTAPDATHPERHEALLAWVRRHKQPVSWVATILVVSAGLFGWKLVSTRQSERTASQQLNSARFALDSKNFALAASELSRISENYSGTRSANEATLLLAQVRLGQGQSQQAIQVLKDFAPGAAPAYRAQAYGLLGAAYENLTHPKEAAEAYQEAARSSRMSFLRAGFLSDAGRAWLATGDSTRARAAYLEIVTELSTTASAFEAKERLGELGEGSN